ncbi:TetR/AcrR family transcriptional regulator [Leucobacter aridicollis]|uniref:TetR/AcrR family transcriptional regulator n=1 Tax=Leucobacter aridicollis TaxID=283878 RepID=UPI002169D29C|nr:TetR family transcriptional regulator [Leucobacter aridicollis]MCS3428671.1 AcrR family transcriptional regulator [Leucobacter aridicollis]
MSECQEFQSNPERPVPPTAPLSRASITDAAIDFIEEKGLTKLSMRALASTLGCGTMSLYSHVKNRDDLIAAIVQELLERSRLLQVTGTTYPTWQEQIRASLFAYRDLAAAYPASFELLALAPYGVAPVAEHLEGIVESLRRAGVPADRAYVVLGALDAYATGFLMVWARTQAEADGTAPVEPSPLTELRTLAAFDHGLDVFIAGFEREFTP